MCKGHFRVLLVIISALLIFAVLLETGLRAQMPNLRPKEGYVPDAATANKIADAVLVAMFGEDYVKNERPFSAVLNNGTWVIHGKTFDEPHPGGSVEIKIDKRSASVLSVTRGK